MLSNQVRYSLVDRAPERGLLPYAEAHGRLVIAYSPLGQGLLSGRYHAGTTGLPTWYGPPVRCSCPTTCSALLT